MPGHHALREEGDIHCNEGFEPSGYFLSTPPRGGTTQRFRQRCRPAISIHALREEGDAAKSMWNAQPAEFLSTPSARRATSHAAGLTPGKYFYPRPPRGGRHGAVVVLEGLFQFLSTPSARRATRFPAALPAITRDFYPRPPRGGRPMSSSFFSSVMEFLSTPSARRATRG